MSHVTKFQMALRCPDCAPEVALVDRGTRLECGNCGADLLREEAFVSVADAEAFAAESSSPSRGAEETATFEFHLDRARRAINDADGAIWPINSFSDADELNSLVEAAVDEGVIAPGEAAAYVSIYPLSICEPDPVLAVSRVRGPSLLGYSLKLRERDGETPLGFTLRLLEEIAGAANALLADLEVSR